MKIGPIFLAILKIVPIIFSVVPYAKIGTAAGTIFNQWLLETKVVNLYGKDTKMTVITRRKGISKHISRIFSIRFYTELFLILIL